MHVQNISGILEDRITLPSAAGSPKKDALAKVQEKVIFPIL
jgi:hypothetical protein